MQKQSFRRLAVIGIAAALASSQSGAAAATDSPDSGRYGSPANDMPFDHEIRLSTDTRSVTVRRLDTVRFRGTDGREFTWRFDTPRPDTFPLARIAPPGAAVPANASVYVLPPIPIAP